MHIDDFIFRPLEEKFARRDRGTPFVIWRIFAADRDLGIGAVVGKTWYKAIPARWMVASGEYTNHERYGPQLELDTLKIAATPYHEALARAISWRMRPYRRSNESVVFDWIRGLSIDEVLRLWTGDKDFMVNVECGEQAVKDTLCLIASLLRHNDSNDNQIHRYCKGEKEVSFVEWWRYLCWGGLMNFTLSETGALLAGGVLDIDKLKADPYLSLAHRQDMVENPKDYVSWFDWIDYVARTLKRAPEDRRRESVVMAALLTKTWEERSVYAQAKPLSDFIQSDDFYTEHFPKLSTTDVVATLRKMQSEQIIEIDRTVNAVYPRERYDRERATAELLCRRFKFAKSPDSVELKKALAQAHAEMEKQGKPLTDDQIKAVEMPFHHPVSLLTGLPGTGKTTCLRAIVHAALALGWRVGIAAPTGIASKNCARTTDHSAWTVHRLFGWVEGGWRFSNEEGLLHDYDLLIADESSMLSLDLLHTICNGVENFTRIMLTGDPEQLPSVSPGAPFRDAIRSSIERVHLVDVHRQAAQSGIIRMAHDISKGALKSLSAYGPEVTHTQVTSASVAKGLLMRGLPKAHTLDLAEFQILTPTNVGEMGTTKLNKELSSELNPGQRTWLGYKGYKEGDKILVTRNDYQAGVFNGELGTLIGLGSEDAMLDIFGAPQTTTLSRTSLTEDVDLGYAITIHKSQGSEFDRVVLALDPGFVKHLFKNLLYTAVTRAKGRLDILCDEHSFREACQRTEPAPRFSQLTRWIEDAKKKYSA